ncbi:hypothetical protein [Desulfosoma caldarium]|uniref:hypothetical protein n=1 Tax=Desulfosoma caldarium TaxID=610254 RepID=UPI0014742053|nr:hypothetical protein [Desulfosoma caldarium]
MGFRSAALAAWTDSVESGLAGAVASATTPSGSSYGPGGGESSGGEGGGGGSGR